MPQYGFDVYKFDQHKFDDQTIFKDFDDAVAIEETYYKTLEKITSENVEITDDVVARVYKALEDLIAVADEHNLSVAKVLEDTTEFEELVAKHLQRIPPKESLTISDDYVLTASPDVRERPRVVEEMVKDFAAKRSTEIAIEDEIELEKSDKIAYTFVGVDATRMPARNLQITDSVNDMVTQCSFQVRNPTEQQRRALHFRAPVRVLVIEGDTSYLFAGRITDATSSTSSRVRDIDVTAEDYTAEAADFTVVGEYSGNIKTVLTEIWNEFYEKPFSLDIQDTEREVTARFNYEPLHKATSYILDQIGWDWFVDFDGAERIFKAFPPEYDIYEKTLTGGDILADSVDIGESDEIHNAIYLFGGEGKSDEVNQHIVADGDNRTFSISYRPVDLTIEKDGEELTWGMDQTDSFDDFDVLVNLDEKTLAFDEPPEEGNVIDLKHKYRYPVVVYLEDKESISRYGKSVKRIDDEKVVDPQQARKRVEQELAQKAYPSIEGSLSTLDHHIRAGQYVEIDFPDFDLQGMYHVVEVQKDVDPVYIQNTLNINKVTDSASKFIDKIKELDSRIGNLESQQRQDIVVQEFLTIGENLEMEDYFEITLERVGVNEFGEARWDFGLWA